MEEQEIIEVEAVDKSIHEAKPNAKPKKAKKANKDVETCL